MRGSASTTVTFGAELGEGGAELQPDIAGADDDQPLGHLGRAPAPRSTRSPRRRTAGRQFDRLRAGGDHHLLGADRPAAPVSVSTSTVLPSRNRAQPATILTPAFFSSPATPLVSRPTMPSFQAIVRARSSRGLRGRDAERVLARAPSARRFANSSAAWISAFDGMQPTLRQVPPGFVRLDDHRVEAELAGADRADIAAGTGADHQQLGRRSPSWLSLR